ncbi:MAG TPA: hypothetical protein VNV41_13520 [Candidatus Acidoferrales bacterium]|jgi:hypothetical protein|nr:hypothetical protein [Candidatus Acidoferrales bacterium]
MMTANLQEMGDLFLRFFACILLIPLISAAVVYWRGQFARAMIWNGSLPILLLCASVPSMVVNPTQITAGGLLYTIPPVAGLAVCTAGYLRHGRNPLLFWFPWSVNLAIEAFLLYLAFWFHISF